MNCAKVYMKHIIISHIILWSFSLPHDLWAWMAVKGQIEVIETVSPESGMLWPKFTWNPYSKSYMIFHLTSWSLTLDDLHRPDRGNVCLMGCIYWILHVVIWICVNNEQIWLPGNYGSDFEQYLNRLQLHPISLLVNFSHELAHIMTTYDFLWAKEVILSNVPTDCNLTQFQLLANFLHELAQIMPTYDFL